MITYDQYDHPLIIAELEGRTHSLVVSVGSRFPLFLCKETLDTINKQPLENGEWHNIDGTKCEAPSYLIPKIKIGNLTLKKIQANQIVQESFGKLGKFLGQEFNLLLDFPRQRIIACDTFSKLQDKKIVNKDWIGVPFELREIGIVFCVDTDFGSRKLLLNTTSTTTYLRSSLIPPSTSFPFVSSSFSLEGRHFGNVTFHPIDLPEGLNEIDGFIGMDFLKEHALYLDCTNELAHFEPHKEYFEYVPVAFATRKAPIIDVSLEGRVYPFKLDIGNTFSFSLQEEILQSIRKTKYGTSKWYDFRGKQYESPAYTIPEIKIGNLSFTGVLANQDLDDFHANVTFDGPPSQFPGIIGRSILEKYNLFLDFPHSAIYASTNHLRLQQAGLLSQNCLTIPFSPHPDGILLSVETDAGIYRLMLDTGASCTVIRTPHPESTEKFQIMGHDFGKHSIKALDVTSRFDFDGFLGMDFLLEHPLYIDYTNRQILIDLQYEKNKKPSKVNL